MHFIVLIIIPENIYFQGINKIKQYISDIMEKYDENFEVDPYIYKTKNILLREYKNSFEVNYDEYIKKNYDDVIFDENGNILTRINKNAIFDYYVIHGRFGNVLVDNNKISDFLEKYYLNKEEYTFKHIIDKNGNLHINNNSNWSLIYENILENAKNDYILNLDCHI